MAKKQKVYQVIHKKTSASGRSALLAAALAYVILAADIVLSAMGWLGHRQIGAALAMTAFVLALTAVYFGKKDMFDPDVKRLSSMIGVIAGGLLLIGVVGLWLWGIIAGAV
ncbi:MAG: hypothetical protein Q4D52_03325 [Eubacteriales bacterium]|nr:hypothetical protein [Eubacteriales bacterium]